MTSFPGTAFSATQYRTLRKCFGRVNLWWGSIRSGKTILSIVAFIRKVVLWEGVGEFIVISNTLGTAYRNLFAPIAKDPLLAAFKPYVKYKVNSTTATIFGREVHVIGASNKAQVSRLRGITAAAIYYDEVTETPEEVFKEALGRMSPPGAQMFATTNPAGRRHWLKVKYIDRVGKTIHRWQLFKLTLYDNPGISPEYIAEVSSEYAGVFYQRLILGEWVAAEGLVFSAFREKPTGEGGNVWHGDLPMLEDFVGVGADYGATNPTTGVRVCLTVPISLRDGDPPRRRLIITDVWGIVPDELHGVDPSTAEKAKAFAEWIKTKPKAQYTGKAATREVPRTIAIDPAAADYRKTVRTREKLAVVRANNAVGESLSLLSSLFAAGTLLIAAACTQLLDEVAAYSWDADEAEKGIDAPVKVDDHWVDAMRYAVLTTKPAWQRDIELTTR